MQILKKIPIYIWILVSALLIGQVENAFAASSITGPNLIHLSGSSIVPNNSNWGFSFPSVTGTSTVTNALQVGTPTSLHPYLFVGTSTTGTAGYGYFPEDFVDVWNSSSANDFTAVNVGSAAVGACAESAFVANGDNLVLNGDFASFANTNTGYTGVGCNLSSPTNVNPESTYIFQPTWDINFALGTTTFAVKNVPTGFKWFTLTGAQQVMVLTNLGQLGIGSSTPTANFQVTATSTATTSAEFGATGKAHGSCLTFFDTAGTAVYGFIPAGATAFTYTTSKPSGCQS